ncbi:hypothetical protein ACFL1E_07960 [Candidatus Omnitrophota bacterium]
MNLQKTFKIREVGTMKKITILLATLFLLTTPTYAQVITATFNDAPVGEPATPNPSGFDYAGDKTVFSDQMAPIDGNGVSLMHALYGDAAPGDNEGQFFHTQLNEGDEFWLRGYFYLTPNQYSGGGGVTYHISSSSGNDANDGLSPATAFRTPAAVAGPSFLQPGDSVLFKRGDTWIGTEANIWIQASGTAENWITFGAYGEGIKPLFRPAKTPAEFGANWISWNHYSGNIYYANTSPNDYIDWWPNTVVQDETTILFPKADLGSMTAGSNYYDGNSKRLYVWCSDNASPDTHNMLIATRWPGWRGTITTDLGAKYILIQNLDIKYAGNQGFTATDDYVWFKNCTVEYAYSAGFYWIHYTAHPSFDGADYGRADHCIARYTCIGDSQAFTIEGSYTWLYDCLAEYNFMAGFDWLDYNEFTDCHHSGAVRCVANQNALRPGSWDPNYYIDGARYIWMIDCVSYDAGGDDVNYHPGIAIHNEHPWAVDMHHIYVINCLSYGHKGVAIDVGDYSSNDNMDYIYLYGNTFIRGPDSFRTLVLKGMDNATYGIDFRNNVVSGDGDSIVRWAPNFLQDKYHGDYNVFYRNGSTPDPMLFMVDRYGSGGEVNTSLAEWQAFTGQDAHSIEGNPQFVNNADVPFGHYFLSNRLAGDPVDSPALNFADETNAGVELVPKYTS